MDFPRVTLDAWRAQVEKELGGKPFDKTLVQASLEGIPIEPLYTQAPTPSELARESGEGTFRICMHHACESERPANLEALLADVEGGADALWLPASAATDAVLAHEAFARTFFVLDVDTAPADVLARVVSKRPEGSRTSFSLGWDPIGLRVAGEASQDGLAGDLATLGALVKLAAEKAPGVTSVVVSTLPSHDAGADAVQEIATALATGARYLEALLGDGLSPDEAARAIALRVAVGRDTFLELCKLRALRIVWQKLLAAVGVGAGARATKVHAVASSRTLTVRDPWVNMLRTTTQAFAGILGGADLVTPTAFDEAFGQPSVLGRRVARNTGLVLREESVLGKVVDAAGGSYFFESLTDALARKAWEAFRDVEREGGIVATLASGRFAENVAKARAARFDQIAKRKMPLVGVSEFANLDETLPAPIPEVARDANTTHDANGARDAAAAHNANTAHDAAAFEALRARADAITRAHGAPEVLLVTLGSFAESRPRAGFAKGFFAAGGIRARETTSDEKAKIACLCGTDEHYQAHAADRARALKAAGCERVLLAGRPGALESSLREAGVDGFVHVGCDVPATLGALLELWS